METFEAGRSVSEFIRTPHPQNTQVGPGRADLVAIILVAEIQLRWGGGGLSLHNSGRLV